MDDVLDSFGSLQCHRTVRRPLSDLVTILLRGQDFIDFMATVSSHQWKYFDLQEDDTSTTVE